MRNIIVVAALAMCCSAATVADTPMPTTPQGKPPNYGCPGPAYQQFKFWLGEWRVMQWRATAPHLGKFAGDSKIDLLAAGCVIFESWKSGSGGSGHSINVYDQADDKWHQTWVDATGDQVHYIGRWTNGKMEFRAHDVATPQKQSLVLTMTFEPRTDGTVRQTGTVSSDGGKTFTTTFDLIYTRKE